MQPSTALLCSCGYRFSDVAGKRTHRSSNAGVANALTDAERLLREAREALVAAAGLPQVDGAQSSLSFGPVSATAAIPHRQASRTRLPIPAATLPTESAKTSLVTNARHSTVRTVSATVPPPAPATPGPNPSAHPSVDSAEAEVSVPLLARQPQMASDATARPAEPANNGDAASDPHHRPGPGQTAECPNCTAVVQPGTKRCRCGFVFVDGDSDMPTLALGPGELAAIFRGDG